MHAAPHVAPLRLRSLAMKISALVTALALTVLLAGCGTKGPLYLPKKGPGAPTQPAPLPDPINPPVPSPTPSN
jgi:predicted small lipoprotein YifL